MQEVLTVKANVGCLPGYPEQGKKKEWSVEDMKNKEQSDANTSCHVWPQRYCLLLNGLQKIVSKLRNKYRRFRILYK